MRDLQINIELVVSETNIHTTIFKVSQVKNHTNLSSIIVRVLRKATVGVHAWPVYEPLAWNCLPNEIRSCDETEAFKRNLKTHLCVKFVNESTAIWFWRIIVKCTGMLSAQFVALYKPYKPIPKTIWSWKQRGMMTLIASGYLGGTVPENKDNRL